MKMKQGLASVRLYFRAGPPISHLAERMTRVVALPLVLVALFSGCSGVVPKEEIPPVVDLMPSFGSMAVLDMSFPTHTAISDVTLPEASDGDGALSYTFEPVPPGLSFNAADRVLSGTPTTVDVYDVTYRVADEDGDASFVELHHRCPLRGDILDGPRGTEDLAPQFRRFRRRGPHDNGTK